MATFIWPQVGGKDIIPSTVDFGIKYNTRINVSPLSGSTQTIELPAARWVASLSFDGMEPEETRVLAAFLAQLRGASGRFLVYDFSHPTPRGIDNLTDTVTVNGASQTGNSLITSGWTFPSTGILEPGDYIKIDDTNEVKVITSTVTTVGSSAATLNFEPPIRISPTTGTNISRVNCSSVMLLSNDENRWSTNNSGLLSSINMECSEVF